MSGRWRLLRRRSARLYGTVLGKAVLLVVFLIALTTAAGALVYAIFDDFGSYPSSMWWAVEHLIDPSQIGEDRDAGERALGLVLVVVGLVVVLGVILEGFADVVARSVRRDEARALEPLDLSGHLLFVGWKEALPGVIAAARRMLVASEGHRPHVVVLAGDELRGERTRIEEQLRGTGDGHRPVLLFGQADADLLFAASAQSARSITVVAEDPRRVGPAVADVDNVKTTFAICRYLDATIPSDHARPAVLTEFVHGAHAAAARNVLPADVRAMIWDRAIAALTALALTTEGWGVAAMRLIGLGTEPTGMHLVADPSLVGVPFGDLQAQLPGALPLGVVSDEGEPLLAPPTERPVAAGERVLVVAHDREAAGRRTLGTKRAPAVSVTAFEHHLGDPRHLLFVGWNDSLLNVLERLTGYPEHHVRVTVLCGSPETHAAIPTPVAERLAISERSGRTTSPATLRDVLASTRADAVMVSATMRDHDADAAAADAEALVALFHLRGLTDAETLVNLFAPDDVGSLGEDPSLDVLPTGGIVNAFLGQITAESALLRSYQSIFLRADERLHVNEFTPSDGRSHSFAEVYQRGLEERCVAVGFVRPDPSGGPGVHVQPPWGEEIRVGDRLLVVTSNEGDDLDAWLAADAGHAAAMSG